MSLQSKGFDARLYLRLMHHARNALLELQHHFAGTGDAVLIAALRRAIGQCERAAADHAETMPERPLFTGLALPANIGEWADCGDLLYRAKVLLDFALSGMPGPKGKKRRASMARHEVPMIACRLDTFACRAIPHAWDRENIAKSIFYSGITRHDQSAVGLSGWRTREAAENDKLRAELIASLPAVRREKTVATRSCA
jgi:hypothetical protein